MLRVIAVTVGLFMSYMSAISRRAGAIMELAKGETKVYNDT
jgi:hypothetical protein